MLKILASFLATTLFILTLNNGALTPMPQPQTNNAVAAMDGFFYSFSGLGAGKTHKDINAHVYRYNIAENSWQTLYDVPGGKTKLASIAVPLKDKIYLFGGYTVADDGTEISTPEVFAFDPESESYEQRTDMPTPVDDTVAVPFNDRYIYLISGWHNEANVALVQLYDAQTDQWHLATEFLGVPVFGHAGGIVDNQIIIIDGVGVVGEVDGRRQFDIIAQSFKGTIDPNNPQTISWEAIPKHPGNALYRAAATGVASAGRIVFAGGSTNAYNYNGIGYNGEPSPPSSIVFSFEVHSQKWKRWADKNVPTMDHRGLIHFENEYITIGGMEEGQKVSPSMHRFSLVERR